MQSYYWANISRQLFSTLCSRKISIWIFSVHFYYKIPEEQICFWIFMWELITKKFRQRLHFKLVNSIKIEPLRAAWNNKCGFLILLFNFFNLIHLFQMELFLSKLIIILFISPIINYIWICNFIMRHILGRVLNRIS
jgi:hypothetical protein